ncbi:hypothetical protein F4778DRAFT_648942 [Xylariomycetidae sp. FL2044]|nr:hypothetical protein F4778DRAFT_648942 [Xylariomycetidae sp. FL2044]
MDFQFSEDNRGLTVSREGDHVNLANISPEEFSAWSAEYNNVANADGSGQGELLQGVKRARQAYSTGSTSYKASSAELMTHPPTPQIEHAGEPQERQPAPHGRRLKNGKIRRNTRKTKKDKEGRSVAVTSDDPMEFYGPPPARPKSWGPRDRAGKLLFNYTECGELELRRTYSREELKMFLLGPKPTDTYEPPEVLPGVPVVGQKRRKGLTCWLGWPPAQCNERYPHDRASKMCRFEDCPVAHNTIRQGHPIVVLDERHNADGRHVDPFHNAGYLHLHCFERLFDIVRIWALMDIRVDDRKFQREDVNYFRLDRHNPDATELVWDYYRRESAKVPAGTRNRHVHENTLTYALIKAELDMEHNGRRRSRLAREGLDMSKHMGDLEYQRRLDLYKKHKLLDGNQEPVDDAAERLFNLTGEPVPEPIPDPPVVRHSSKYKAKRQQLVKRENEETDYYGNPRVPMPPPLGRPALPALEGEFNLFPEYMYDLPGSYPPAYPQAYSQTYPLDSSMTAGPIEPQFDLLDTVPFLPPSFDYPVYPLPQPTYAPTPAAGNKRTFSETDFVEGASVPDVSSGDMLQLPQPENSQPKRQRLDPMSAEQLSKLPAVSEKGFVNPQALATTTTTTGPAEPPSNAAQSTEGEDFDFGRLENVELPPLQHSLVESLRADGMEVQDELAGLLADDEHDSLFGDGGEGAVEENEDSSGSKDASAVSDPFGVLDDHGSLALDQLEAFAVYGKYE